MVEILLNSFLPTSEWCKISRYNMDCDCRKPKPGMILQAINKYGLIKENTFWSVIAEEI